MLILKGVDGVVFVADVESLSHLTATRSRACRWCFSTTSATYRRRSPSPSSIGDHPRFEAIAMQGVGVFDTLELARGAGPSPG